MLPPQKIDGDYEAPKSEIWIILRLHVCKFPLHPVNAQIRASLAWPTPPTYPQIRSPDQEGWLQMLPINRSGETQPNSWVFLIPTRRIPPCEGLDDR